MSPAVAHRYREWTAGAEAPPGTVIIEKCADAVSAEPRIVYGMEKRENGAWDYIVAAKDGSIHHRGALRLCARCHIEAVSDSVFGLSPAITSKLPAE